MGSLVDKAVETIVGNPDDVTRPIKDFKVKPFQTRGLSGKFQDGTFRLAASPALQEASQGLQTSLRQRGQEFRGLLPEVNPAFQAAQDARIESLRNRERRAIGNLRENLARRRIAGSSFAGDAMSRAKAEFAQQEDQIRAQTQMEELDATMRILDQATQAETAASQSALKQLNLESELGANLSNNLNQLDAQMAQMESQVLTEYAGARANILGTAIGAGAGVAALK